MMDAAVETFTSDYKVNLEVFSGPLDLLLYLIRKEEVDIYDIPIAKVTSQYLKYLELMQTLNLEVAGEFILMAATLIRIKTRLLLPRDESEPEEEDPREELIMALVEYKKYKEAGELLRERALLEDQTYVPPSPLGKIEGKVDLSPATSLFDMLAAFKDVMASQREEIVHEVVPEEISIEDRIKAVVLFLKARESATFQELFADVPKRIIAVVTFIALLELARTRRIRIMQAMPFSELRVYRGEFFEATQLATDTIDYTQLTEQVEV
ncbi:MAG: segregation/condensation protein A [Candidatus Zixiibacteriota bacterium]